MAMLRTAALRSSPPTLFSRTASGTLRRTTSQPCLRLAQQTGRRGYASAHGTTKKTSDLPWAATGGLLTVVGTYLALQPRDPVSHDDHHGEEHKGHEEKEEKESEEKSDEPEEKSEEKKDDSDDSKEEEPKDESEEEADADKDAKQGETVNKENIKKVEKDEGKDATNIPLDSPAGKSIGVGASSGEAQDPQAGQSQKGISNTDTKHSTDPHADSGKSSKGEGTAESAKVKGTVKVDRKQV